MRAGLALAHRPLVDKCHAGLCANSEPKPVILTQRLARAASTVLSIGLNIVIERLGIDPRWRYAVWALIVANEIRGILVVYEISDAAFAAI
jgi:hypothetical protein